MSNFISSSAFGVEREFHAPLLGAIPQFPPAHTGNLIDEGSENLCAEAYRVLRTNIQFFRKDDKQTAFVIVSTAAGEGRSTTTLNLAAVFTWAGRRILVVDSDLRRPTLHKLLHHTNDIGFADYLLKQNTLEEVIQTTGVANLDFMASGKPSGNSTVIPASSQLKEMIGELKPRYDFILFDSPFILGASDALRLAGAADQAIHVIQHGRYPKHFNLRAKQMIEEAGGNVLGVVLNNIDAGTLAYGK